MVIVLIQSLGHSLDHRLLAGLVQDVWDKFREQRMLLSRRQRREAEATWMLQQEQWRERLNDLGRTYIKNYACTIIPIIIPTVLWVFLHQCLYYFPVSPLHSPYSLQGLQTRPAFQIYMFLSSVFMIRTTIYDISHLS